MSDAVATPGRSLPLLFAVVVGVAVLVGTVALWAHYGTAIFFEIVRTGFIACFG